MATKKWESSQPVALTMLWCTLDGHYNSNLQNFANKWTWNIGIVLYLLLAIHNIKMSLIFNHNEEHTQLPILYMFQYLCQWCILSAYGSKMSSCDYIQNNKWRFIWLPNTEAPATSVPTYSKYKMVWYQVTFRQMLFHNSCIVIFRITHFWLLETETQIIVKNHCVSFVIPKWSMTHTWANKLYHHWDR